MHSCDTHIEPSVIFDVDEREERCLVQVVDDVDNVDTAVVRPVECGIVEALAP